MALRPLSFGARMRHGDRTLRVRKDARGYVVEDEGRDRDSQRRQHAKLEGALRDLARTWRGRLN